MDHFLNRNLYVLFPPKWVGWLFLSLCFFSACSQSSDDLASLFIEAEKPGSLAIFRRTSSSYQALLSSGKLEYNKELKLQPGDYLVLADCSHKLVSLKKGTKKRLKVYTLHFEPPFKANKEDSFQIFCTQDKKLGFKQKIKNVFHLQTFNLQKKVMIGGKSLLLKDVSEKIPATKSSFKIALSAVSVQSDFADVSMMGEHFFLTSKDQSHTILTQSQALNRWVFVSPGSYSVMLNNTQEEITLQAKQSLSLPSSAIELRTTKLSRLEKHPQHYNFLYKVNGHFGFSLNQKYLMLGSKINLQLTKSSKIEEISLRPKHLTTIDLSEVFVDLACSPYEVECFGARKVYLFEQGKSHYMMEGLSNHPLYFFKNKVDIGIGLFRNLRWKIKEDQRKTKLTLGRVVIVPVPTFDSDYITDLMRIQTKSDELSGYSDDIKPDGSHSFYLPPGAYQLETFSVQRKSLNKERIEKTKSFIVYPAKTVEVKMPYYLAEKKKKLFISRYLNAKKKDLAKKNKHPLADNNILSF